MDPPRQPRPGGRKYSAPDPGDCAATSSCIQEESEPDMSHLRTLSLDIDGAASASASAHSLSHLSSNMDILQQIMAAKEGDPSQFASYWELDEADINESTLEQIQNDPVHRILWAAETNKMDILQELVAREPSLLAARDDDGYTPLHRASYEGHVPAAKFLLENGADVHAKTNDGWTPLHSAVNWNKAGVANLLIQCGANVNMQSNGGQTPLHLGAANPEAKEVLEILLTNKHIRPELRNNVGETALQICQRTSSLSYLFQLADKSINKLKPS